jgi:hypothetical protein
MQKTERGILFTKKRLSALTELERETILADRRKRIDLLNEHQELKARIGLKLGRSKYNSLKNRIGTDKGFWKGKRIGKIKRKTGK